MIGRWNGTKTVQVPTCNVRPDSNIDKKMYPTCTYNDKLVIKKKLVTCHQGSIWKYLFNSFKEIENDYSHDHAYDKHFHIVVSHHNRIKQGMLQIKKFNDDGKEYGFANGCVIHIKHNDKRPIITILYNGCLVSDKYTFFTTENNLKDFITQE